MYPHSFAASENSHLQKQTCLSRFKCLLSPDSAWVWLSFTGKKRISIFVTTWSGFQNTITNYPCDWCYTLEIYLLCQQICSMLTGIIGVSIHMSIKCSWTALMINKFWWLTHIWSSKYFTAVQNKENLNYAATNWSTTHAINETLIITNSIRFFGPSIKNGQVTPLFIWKILNSMSCSCFFWNGLTTVRQLLMPLSIITY